ncbi:MAG: tRNA uridine-5-carboxymethylaminomethyl(34) synthesis enzyme MnmG, partial [Deltaproteobacteria bacterium]|nr:tRNA uridine-5-carboxymethylaminomethyl(34) synthesis enzyme MnmG [Deltaproteobacteria bacterium]
TPRVNAELEALGQPVLKTAASAADLVRRPEMRLEDLSRLPSLAGRVSLSEYPLDVREQVETGIKYEGYLQRQESQMMLFDRLESIKLPGDFEYAGLSGLSREVVQKLEKHRPANLGQASRISGITPAAIGILAALLRAGGGGQRQAG